MYMTLGYKIIWSNPSVSDFQNFHRHVKFFQVHLNLWSISTQTNLI